MGGRWSLDLAILLMAVLGFHQLAVSKAQTVHVVGDSLGWNVPPAGAGAYSTWASTQTFTVGGILEFNFTTGFHTVAEVTEAAYGPCTTANPISLTSTGPANITLTSAGPHYYICTVGTHCSLGQKLAINVSAAAATPPPSAAPSSSPHPPSSATPPPAHAPAPSPPSPGMATPPPSSIATVPPTPTTTPSPPPAALVAPTPPNSAPSLAMISAALPVTILSVTLAFFY